MAKAKVRFKKRTERVLRAIECRDVNHIIETPKCKQDLTEEQLVFVQHHPRMLSNAFAYHRLPFSIKRLPDHTVVIASGASRGSNIPGIVRDRIGSFGPVGNMTNREIRRKIANAPTANSSIVFLPTIPVATTIPSEAEIRAFYASWDWSRLRYCAVQEAGRTCMCCGATPTDGVRIVVDHIKPIRRFWHLRLDPKNLQVLCDLCNMGKESWDETDFRPGTAVPYDQRREGK